MIFRSTWCLILVVFAVLCEFGCSGKKEGSDTGVADTASQAVVNPYADWKHYTYGKFRIHYPEGHPKEDLLSDMTAAFTTLMRRDAQFFMVTEPSDTIDVYYYTGVGQGRQITDSIYPFADTSAIHFWLPSNYGPIMAKYMIKRWQPAMPTHEFLWHGLVLILEYAGRNHHAVTMDAIDSGEFVPLSELAIDTTLTSNYPQVQGSEAASFVDFIMYAYGLGSFRAMYTATEPFDQVVQRLYSVSVDSLQTLWLNVARQAVNPQQVLDTL